MEVEPGDRGSPPLAGLVRGTLVTLSSQFGDVLFHLPMQDLDPAGQAELLEVVADVPQASFRSSTTFGAPAGAACVVLVVFMVASFPCRMPRVRDQRQVSPRPGEFQHRSGHSPCRKCGQLHPVGNATDKAVARRRQQARLRDALRGDSQVAVQAGDIPIFVSFKSVRIPLCVAFSGAYRSQNNGQE